MERCFRYYVGIRRIIQGHAGTDIEVVLIGIAHEGVACQCVVERIVKIEQPHYVELYGIYLIEEFPSDIARITVGCGYDVSRVFGPVLVIVGQVEIRPRHRTREKAVGQKKKFRETQTGGHSEFIGPDVVVELELEITHEAESQPFPAAENILVVI